jgi:hypothetical protein
MHALARRDTTREAARQALAICAGADQLAREAVEAAHGDDARLLALMEQRDEMLQDLAEHLASLRLERPPADSRVFSNSEAVLDEADALIIEVHRALDRSQRVTMDLVGRLARRSDELRAELDAVQRAVTAASGYIGDPAPRLVDRVR